MRAVHKRYLREFAPAMAAYVVLILGSSWLLPQVGNPAGRALLALLPVLPTMLVIRAIVRVVRDQDELERRIDLEAISISSALAGCGFFAFGLLLSAGVIPAVPGATISVWVLPVLFASFGVVKPVIVWRYRRA